MGPAEQPQSQFSFVLLSFFSSPSPDPDGCLVLLLPILLKHYPVPFCIQRISITLKMPLPYFASPDRVMRAAQRLETLVEIMREHRLEFVAILHASQLYVRWVKAYDRQNLDPEDDDEDWAVDWEHPMEENDVGTLLALALGEMGVGERL